MGSKQQSKPNSINYLSSLQSIRDRCSKVYEKVLNSSPQNPQVCFTINEDRLFPVADFIYQLMRRDYVDLKTDVPPHGRWRHFLPQNSLETRLIQTFPVNKTNLDLVKTILDLIVVSVLLDAGTGSKWKYQRNENEVSGRSEGLAMASMDMFLAGKFSGTKVATQVDAQGLERLTLEDLAQGFQVTPNNPLVGLEGRFKLLQSLSTVLDNPINSVYFIDPQNPSLRPRPGNMIHFIVSKCSDDDNKIDIQHLWQVIMDGFGSVWPASRTVIDGVSLGDVWYCSLLDESSDQNDPSTFNSSFSPSSLVPFHKLSQWLAYSLIEPIERFLPLRFSNIHLLTGLPEYRNGGLFIDFNVVSLKDQYSTPTKTPLFPPHHQVIVQWRALTVILLDKLAPMVRTLIDPNLTADDFPLAKVLEGGSWKAGREIAAKLRPKNSEPPISIVSDGTLF